MIFMDRISEAISQLSKAIEENHVKPTEGLPIKLFEFCTTLLPFINVDLLVINTNNQILLSWRNDKHYGAGWQIPGGIIRMMETLEDRIQKTAIREIGFKVEYDKQPIVIYENIIREQRDGLENQLERAHNIAILYLCRVPEHQAINNNGKTKSDEGYLKWFDKFPQDLLKCHQPLQKLDVMKRWF